MEITQSFIILIINLFFIHIHALSFSSLGNLIRHTPLGFLSCKVEECCNEPWIKSDISDLHNSLRLNLHGQHLVKPLVIGSLRRFISDENPEKALVFSFHGTTGSGKNFVASQIAKHLYVEGLNSKYVHQYVANRDFPHNERISEYQDRLREDVQRFTKECDRSLFIFDEVDKMPAGTIDVLKPFLDHHEHIDGVDYRKNIFIFLSNAGSSGIIDIALEFWADGKDREEITMKSIEPLIAKGSFNERGGFQYSELLSSELIDHFVPFLPLEEKHVQKCIEDKLNEKNIVKGQNFIVKVAQELLYFPPETDLFSKSGCKRIEQKINVLLED